MDTLSRDPSDDLFFEKVVQQYVEDPFFIERNWLVERIEKKLREPTCRFVLLTGEPGIGKTAFMAMLANIHPDWPRYFFRRNSQEPLRDGSLASFFRDIGFQLSARHPALYNSENLKVIISQEPGIITSEGLVKGMEVAELLASPFSKQIFDIKQKTESVSGTMVGAEIKRLIADDYLLDEEKLAFLALLGPARVLHNQEPDARIIILVDALDESPYHSNVENSLVNWLTHCGKLPDNIRFIITSRPDENLKLFKTRQQVRLLEEILDLDSYEIKKKLQEDLREYTAKFVAQQAVKSTLETYHLPSHYFIDQVTEKAVGNLLYLHMLFQAIAAAISKNKDEQLVRLLKLEELPLNLNALYAFFLNLLESEVDDLSPKPYWETLILPILEILAVAKEELTARQIKHFTDLKVQQPLIQKALKRLKQFLDPLEERYRLYHITFAEFLTDPETEESYPDYYLERSLCSQRIIRFYRAQNQSSDIVDWSKLDDYGLKHLASHMEEAGQQDALYKLVAHGTSYKNEWADFHLEKEGSYAGYLRDLDLIWSQATRSDCWNIGRQLRCVLIRSSIHSLVGNLVPELLLLQIQSGSLSVESAFAFIKEIPEQYRYQRANSLKLIAPFLLTKHTQAEDDFVKEILKMAEILADDISIEEEKERLEPLCTVFKYLPLEMREKSAEHLWEKLQAIKSEEDQAQLMVTLWRWLPEHIERLVFERIQFLVQQAFQSVPPRIFLIDTLIAITSFLSRDQRTEILRLVESIRDECLRLVYQAKLIQYWSDERQNNILKNALNLTNQLASLVTLISLLPFLNEQQRFLAINRAWQIIQREASSSNSSVRLAVLDKLCELFLYLSEQQKHEAAEFVWETIPLTAPFIFKKAETLFRLAGHLPPLEQNKTRDWAEKCAQLAINGTDTKQLSSEQLRQRLWHLIKLLPSLSSNQKQELLLLIAHIAHPGERALVLLEILRENCLKYLPPTSQEKLITTIKLITARIGDERERATVLALLANARSGRSYTPALREARRIIDELSEEQPLERENKGRTLLGLVAYLPFDTQIEVVQRAIELMSNHLSIKDISRELSDHINIPLDNLMPRLPTDFQNCIKEMLGKKRASSGHQSECAVIKSNLSNKEKTEKICQILLTIKEKGYSPQCRSELEILLDNWDGSTFFSGEAHRDIWCLTLQASARRSRSHCMLDLLAITLLLLSLDHATVKDDLLQALLDIERWWE